MKRLAEQIESAKLAQLRMVKPYPLGGAKKQQRWD